MSSYIVLPSKICTNILVENMEKISRTKYSVNNKLTLSVLLKYIVVAMTATKVSNSVCSSKKKSNDVTIIPTVHASITVFIHF